MLVAEATAEGVRVSGFLDAASLVLLTCKAAAGEPRTIGFDVPSGLFTHDIALKGYVPIEVIGVPIIKTLATLYVHRPVENAEDIITWFKAQGMETMLLPGDMHITVAFSKARVNWEALDEEDAEKIEFEPTLRRSVVQLGPKGAVVLKMETSQKLQARWKYFINKGASWDWDGYHPHITLTYKADTDPAAFMPYPGRIVLGLEQFAEIVDFDPVEKATTDVQ